MNEQASLSILRKKRLGQYFSGLPVARLLGALAGAERHAAVIDPFLGSGHMLTACLETNPSAQVSGVEIELNAWQDACQTLADPARVGRLVVGNAFSRDTLSRLPTTSLDLVITNPPYVRYQAQAGASPEGLPTAPEVRTGLLETLTDERLFCHLVPYERDLLRELVRGYSGLADLAVPAWLLCAALTRPGGSLAMVVPEAWLSRDYARVVQCMLLRLFRLRHVVEDAHATWFADAVIRTTLVVAERTQVRPSCLGWGKATFLRTDLGNEAHANGSLVGAALPASTEPERRFSKALDDALDGTGPAAGHGWRSTFVDLEAIAQNIVQESRGQPWAGVGLGSIPTMGVNEVTTSQSVPQQLLDWLGPELRGRLSNLEGTGFRVGQGLRTGANDFFYVTLLREEGRESVIQTRDGKVVRAPSACLLEVIRNQEELDGSPMLPSKSGTAKLLWLEGWALPEDSEQATRGGLFGMTPPRVLPTCLSAWIREQSRAGVSGMSAVKTNVRSGSGKFPRWWYTLPSLAPRHRPDLLVPRVNGGSPVPILNADRRFIVDANFSSIWTDLHPDRIPALQILLSTTWCGAALEYLCSVMGGGALKVEATHLRRLPIPVLDKVQWSEFTRLGHQLANGWKSVIIDEADGLLVRVLHGDDALEERIASLRFIMSERAERRCFKARDRRLPPRLTTLSASFLPPQMK